MLQRVQCNLQIPPNCICLVLHALMTGTYCCRRGYLFLFLRHISDVGGGDSKFETLLLCENHKRATTVQDAETTRTVRGHKTTGVFGFHQRYPPGIAWREGRECKLLHHPYTPGVHQDSTGRTMRHVVYNTYISPMYSYGTLK